MSVAEKMTAIADAIRLCTGKSKKTRLDEMIADLADFTGYDISGIEFRTLDQRFTVMANIIRGATGGTSELSLDNMASEIKSLLLVDTPTISVLGDTLTITGEGADHYKIYVDGVEKATTETATFDLSTLGLTDGEYTITVYSVSSNGIISDVSKGVAYTVKTLIAPTVTISGDVLNITNTGANYYHIFNGDKQIAIISENTGYDMSDAVFVYDLSLKISAAGSYIITVVGGATVNNVIQHSPHSEAVTYTVNAPDAPRISISANKILTIDSDAEKFSLYIDGVCRAIGFSAKKFDCVTFIGRAFNLPVGEYSITIRAIKGEDESPDSNAVIYKVELSDEPVPSVPTVTYLGYNSDMDYYQFKIETKEKVYGIKRRVTGAIDRESVTTYNDGITTKTENIHAYINGTYFASYAVANRFGIYGDYSEPIEYVVDTANADAPDPPTLAFDTTADSLTITPAQPYWMRMIVYANDTPIWSNSYKVDGVPWYQNGPRTINDIATKMRNAGLEDGIYNLTAKVEDLLGMSNNKPVAGYWSKMSDPVYYIYGDVDVAKIGSKYYKTLQDAVSDASDGDIISLLGDVMVDAQIDISKSITIDGAKADGSGNYKIASNGFNVLFLVNADNSTLTLQNVDVYHTSPIFEYSAIYLASKSSVSLNLLSSNLYVLGNSAIFMRNCADNSNLVITGSTVVSTHRAIQINYEAVKIDVANSKLVSTGDYETIYLYWYTGEINIENSILSAANAKIIHNDARDIVSVSNSTLGGAYNDLLPEGWATYTASEIAFSQEGNSVSTFNLSGTTNVYSKIVNTNTLLTVNFGAENEPFNGTQIIRQSSNKDYYFYDDVVTAVSAAGDADTIFTYSKDATDELPQGYNVYERVDVYGVTYYKIVPTDAAGVYEHGSDFTELLYTWDELVALPIVTGNPFWLDYSDNRINEGKINGDLVIPEGVINISDLYCANIIIPSTVKTISYLADLYYCMDSSASLDTRMEIMCIKATEPPSVDGFSSEWANLKNIVVPKGCGEAYKAATWWCDFAEIIVEADE